MDICRAALFQHVFRMANKVTAETDCVRNMAKGCPSPLNLLLSRNSLRFLDLEVASPKIECACRHETSTQVSFCLELSRNGMGMARLGNPGQPRSDTGNPTDNLLC